MEYYCNFCKTKFPESEKLHAFNIIEALSLDLNSNFDLSPPLALEKIALETVLIEIGTKWVECPNCSCLVERLYNQNYKFAEYKECSLSYGNRYDLLEKRLLQQQQQVIDMLDMSMYEDSTDDDSEINEIIDEALRILRRENIVHPPVMQFGQSSVGIVLDFLIGDKPRSHNTRLEVGEIADAIQIIVKYFPQSIIENPKYESFFSPSVLQGVFVHKDLETYIAQYLAKQEHVIANNVSNTSSTKQNYPRCKICNFRLSPAEIKKGADVCLNCTQNNLPKE